MEDVEIEFLEWINTRYGVVKIEKSDKTPVILKARIKKTKKEWIGLTDEEIWEWFGKTTALDKSSAFFIYKAIEAKLKEKNYGV